MKSLRLLRNIGALFILGMALLISRPESGFSQPAAGPKLCLTKIGYTGCTLSANGQCSDTKCAPGQPCADYGCIQVKCFFCF